MLEYTRASSHRIRHMHGQTAQPCIRQNECTYVCAQNTESQSMMTYFIFILRSLIRYKQGIRTPSCVFNFITTRRPCFRVNAYVWVHSHGSSLGSNRIRPFILRENGLHALTRRLDFYTNNYWSLVRRSWQVLHWSVLSIERKIVLLHINPYLSPICYFSSATIGDSVFPAVQTTITLKQFPQCVRNGQRTRMWFHWKI